MRFRSPTKKMVAWFGFTFLLWGAASAATVREASRQASSAADRSLALETLAQDPTSIDSEGIDELVVEMKLAGESFDSARSELDSLALKPLYWAPFIGRQLSSARALANVGSVTTNSLIPAAETVQSFADGTLDGGRADLAFQLADQLDTAEADMAGLTFGPDANLVTPLAEARATAIEKSNDLVQQVGSARSILAGLGEFLKDSHYLILVANNAEMRLGSGMPLSIGRVEMGNDSLRLVEIGPTHAQYPVKGAEIVDDFVAARWGFVFPSDDYRKLTYSARFAEYSGPQALEMWEATTGDRPDGVLLIDPFLLSSLLEVTGPVTADGVTIDSDNALSFFLIEQYEEFDDRQPEVQDQRRDRQAILAAAIFTEFTTSDWSPFDLLRALKPAARGRHLMAYSSDPTQQRAWSELGISGELDGDEVGVFLLNLTASKLDPFINVSVEQSEVATPDGVEVSLEIEVANLVPPGPSDFASGLWQELGLGEGDHLARLAIYAPAGAENLRFEPEVPLEVMGADGQVWLMVRRLTVKRAQAETVTVKFDLPAGIDTMTVLPSARFPGTIWTVDGVKRIDDSPIVIDLGGG